MCLLDERGACSLKNCMICMGAMTVDVELHFEVWKGCGAQERRKAMPYC